MVIGIDEIIINTQYLNKESCPICGLSDVFCFCDEEKKTEVMKLYEPQTKEDIKD
jgi:hypothetical protein